MSRGKEIIMKDMRNNRTRNPNPNRVVDIERLDDVLNVTGLIELAPGEEMVSLPRSDYDVLVQHSAIHDAICRLLTQDEYISEHVLRSLLNLPKAVAEK